MSSKIDRSPQELNPDFRSFRLLSLLAMAVQISNLVVIDNQDLVLVCDVLEFIRNCVINVSQPFMFESDVALPLYVCFRSTHEVFNRRCVEQKLIVKLGIGYFNCLLNA